MSDIAINVVEAVTLTPELNEFSLSSFPAGATLNFQCTQVGTAYFALSTSNSTLNALTLDTVKDATHANGISQTDPELNDSTFTKYIFVDILTANVTRTFQINKLASNKNYSIFGVCFALSNKVSPV
jgi:hypothetical protein